MKTAAGALLVACGGLGAIGIICTIVGSASAVRAAPPEELSFDSLRVPGGSPERGREIVHDRGCTACHVIPGLPGPYGRVGPRLAELDRRAYIAGTLPNRPGTLVRWLRDPPALDPTTAMPSLGLTEQEARDVAAFLTRTGRR